MVPNLTDNSVIMFHSSFDVFICIDGDNVCLLKFSIPRLQLGNWGSKHLEVPACTEVRLTVGNEESLPIKIRG